MPTNASGEYIWLATSSPKPYSVIEGEIVTDQPLSEIIKRLNNEFISYQSTSSEQAVFGLRKDSSEPYNMLIVRKDLKFCIIWLGELEINDKISEIFRNLYNGVNDIIESIERALSQKTQVGSIKLIKISHQISSHER